MIEQVAKRIEREELEGPSTKRRRARERSEAPEEMAAPEEGVDESQRIEDERMNRPLIELARPASKESQEEDE